MNGAPQEIKVKINESRLPKFYQQNSTERKFNWKKISTENSAEKDLKENSKFNNTLKPPKNIIQLNTKPGFSVTHFLSNFIPPKIFLIDKSMIFLFL